MEIRRQLVAVIGALARLETREHDQIRKAI